MITMSKRFKKSMAMAMATAMAFSIPAMPVYQAEKVEAATVKEAEATSALDVNVYEDQELANVSLKNGAEADVLYYAVTTKDKNGNVKYPKAAAYEAMKFDENGTADFDISWVNRKKEQVLCVATGSSIEEIKPVTVDLKAQDTLMATYAGTVSADDANKVGTEGANIVGDADNGYLTFNTGTKKAPVAVSASAVQFRTVNGWWNNAEDIDLSTYAAKGATLQMRVNAEDGVRPYGKIVNVKIKAKSKAPNVTVNYNDKMVSVPKSVEYSVDNGKTWKKASADGKKVSVELGDYGWDGTKEETVYFRTEGTDKKSSSKIKYVTIKKEDTSFAKLEAPVSGAAVIVDVPKVGDGKLDVRYKTAYKNDSGLVFTNTTDNIYQVAFAKKADIEDYVSADGTTLKAISSAAIVAKSAKKVTWATVSAQDTAKSKVGTGKLSLKKGEKLEDYVLLYRICDKKGATVNSEVRVFDVPGVVAQSVKVLDADKAETTSVEITTTGSAVMTVTGSGISDSAKYTVAAYKEEACTTVYKDLTVTFDKTKKELTVKSKAKTVAGTYYVKVSVEGTSTVLKVVVK